MGFGRFLAGTSVSALLIGSITIPSSATETVTYSYDALGRLVTVQSSGTVNNNFARSLCYDAAGNRTIYKASTTGGTAGCVAVSTPSPSPSPTPVPAPTPAPTPTPTPSLSIGDAADYEAATLSFTVSLSASSSSTVTVNYATAYGTAGSADFTSLSGTLTFSPGQTLKAIAVVTRTDARMENDETFYINLSGPAGAVVSRGQGVGTIFDDGGGGGGCGGQICE